MHKEKNKITRFLFFLLLFSTWTNILSSIFLLIFPFSHEQSKTWENRGDPFFSFFLHPNILNPLSPKTLIEISWTINPRNFICKLKYVKNSVLLLSALLLPVDWWAKVVSVTRQRESSLSAEYEKIFLLLNLAFIFPGQLYHFIYNIWQFRHELQQFQ